jgi:hypothetical protein
MIDSFNCRSPDSLCVALTFDQRHRLGTRSWVLSETTHNGGGYRHGARFLYTPKCHTSVLGLDHDHYANRLELIKQGFRDLLREAFLHLKPPSKGLRDPSEL